MRKVCAWFIDASHCSHHSCSDSAADDGVMWALPRYVFCVANWVHTVIERSTRTVVTHHHIGRTACDVHVIISIINSIALTDNPIFAKRSSVRAACVCVRLITLSPCRQVPFNPLHDHSTSTEQQAFTDNTGGVSWIPGSQWQSMNSA